MNKLYTCISCGKLFYELPSKYATGKFCSENCARRYSSNVNKQNRINKIKVTFQKKRCVSKEAFKEKYKSNPKLCSVCGKPIDYEKRFNKTCSTECAIKATNKNRRSYEDLRRLNEFIVYGKHIVYRTTNKLNGKFYIGVHKEVIKGNYLGSGIAINNAIKKYGKNNFIRETLFEFDNSKDAFEKEFELISQNIYNEKCLNMANGGFGGILGKKKCRYCGREITINNIKRHEEVCKLK